MGIPRPWSEPSHFIDWLAVDYGTSSDNAGYIGKVLGRIPPKETREERGDLARDITSTPWQSTAVPTSLAPSNTTVIPPSRHPAIASTLARTTHHLPRCWERTRRAENRERIASGSRAAMTPPAGPDTASGSNREFH